MNRTSIKPSLLKYKNLMIPHILPIKAKELGITSKDKSQWSALKGKVRKQLEEKYQMATADELIRDLSYKRYSQKQKEKQRTLNRTKIGIQKDRLHVLKEKYISSEKNTVPQSIVTDDPTESKLIVQSISVASENTRLWIEERRFELLQKISKVERTFAEAIAKAGYKVIVKMPFMVANKIYFSQLYIPAFRLAIDISTSGIRDAEKTGQLKHINVTRFQFTREDVEKHNAIGNIIQYISKC